MESSAAVGALSALAQETRLAIFRMLVEHGSQGSTPGAIAEALGLAAPTLSFHLKELGSAGLIDSRQDGRFIIYMANFAAMHRLVEFLYHNCCGASSAARDANCVPAAGVGNIRSAAKSSRGGK